MESEELSDSKRKEAIQTLQDAKKNIEKNHIPYEKATLLQNGIFRETNKINTEEQKNTKNIDNKVLENINPETTEIKNSKRVENIDKAVISKDKNSISGEESKKNKNKDVNKNENKAIKSDIEKQIESKVKILDSIKKNIDDNIKVIENYDPKKQNLAVNGSEAITSIFSKNKFDKENAEEYARAGIPEMKKIAAVEKPKKSKGWLWMLIVGIAQVVIGGFLF